uniref:Uncharacterized protein n=1 Tax=Rhizophora mucronata TaxID=61149 RepID=A0A2P2NBC2_RHIMU
MTIFLLHTYRETERRKLLAGRGNKKEALMIN